MQLSVVDVVDEDAPPIPAALLLGIRPVNVVMRVIVTGSQGRRAVSGEDHGTRA
jgi:hypothetical protein